jgi:hypothetical protein
MGAVMIAAGLLGCEEDADGGGAKTTTTASHAGSPPEQRASAGPDEHSGRASRSPFVRPLTGPAAFDVVATGRGAVVFWGPPGGGLRARTLGKRSPAGDVDVQLGSDSGAVREVAAAAGGGRLGVAWVAEHRDGARVFAARGDATARAFGPATRLADLQAHSGKSRGWVALAAAPSGALDVLYRSGAGRCAEGTGKHGCVHFRHHRLGGGGEDPGRRGVSLVVPEPCERAVTGNVHAAGAWYYGICAVEQGVARTTLYALQFEPEYAHAEPVLRGCQPLGMTPLANGAVVTGACGSARRAAVLRKAGQSRQRLGDVELTTRCEQGRPVLVAEGTTSVERSLRGPVSRLEALLPGGLAPEGSRSAWSGRELWVASIGSDGKMRVNRYECRKDKLSAAAPAAGR